MSTVIGAVKPTAPRRVSHIRGPLADRGPAGRFPDRNRAVAPVLRGIDLSVKPGEVLGLVGESGAGKTTLARSILGAPPAPGRIAAGRVIFEGRDILTLPEKQLRRAAWPPTRHGGAEPAR